MIPSETLVGSADAELTGFAPQTMFAPGFRRIARRRHRLAYATLCIIAALGVALCVNPFGWARAFGLEDARGFAPGLTVLGLAAAGLVTESLRWRRMRFCPTCGAVARFPFGRVGHGYCPGCGHLLDPRQLGPESPGVLDLSYFAESCPREPVPAMIGMVVLQALRDQATEVRFEPGEHQVRLTYRTAGVLHDLVPPPVHLQRPLARAFKAIAGLDIDEEEHPQEGRVLVRLGGPSAVMDVATEPTKSGEIIVLRFLPPGVGRGA